MKPIRWPFWAALGTAALAWLAVGLTVPQDDVNLNDVFNGVALAAFFAALLFIVVYTVQGLMGPAKWWRNNIGTYLILAAASVMAIIGPTAYAVLFHDGSIDTFWLGWAYIGGHFLAAIMWAALALVWVRNRATNGTS